MLDYRGNNTSGTEARVDYNGFAPATFHQYKGRKSATQGYTLFVDNALIGTDPITNPMSEAPTSLVIGASSGNFRYVDGTLKNLAVYSGDLTDEQVTEL